MKNIKKVVYCVSLSVLVMQISLSAFSLPVYAVSPGWSSSDTKSSSSSVSSSSQVSSSIKSSSSEPESSSSQSNFESSSSIPSSESSSLRNFSHDTSNNSSNVSNSSSREDSEVSSSSSSSSSDSFDSDSDFSSSSVSESTSSSSTVAESIKTYSISELLDAAYLRYKSCRIELISENKQRVVDNNNKGAKELYSAYRKALKNIKSGKTTLQEREESVASQKSSLQEALSVRLNSLQNVYNQQVQNVQNKINALPDDHAHDVESMRLKDQLTSLDYELSHNSNLAYTRYNNAVTKLNRQAEHTSVKSKKDQRSDVKATYLENLLAVHAQDPKSLSKENSKKLSDLKSKYKEVKKMIKNKDISSPSDIYKYF